MIRLFIDLWDKNKDNLENYFRNTNIIKYGTTYTDLLKTIINEVLNNSDLGVKFSDKVEKIQSNDYSDIMILTFSLDVDYPSVNDIFYTSIDYGSCIACDAIQTAYNEDDFDTMIKLFMILSLHLVQHMKCYGNIEASKFITYEEDNVFNIINAEKKRQKAIEIAVVEKEQNEFYDESKELYKKDGVAIEIDEEYGIGVYKEHCRIPRNSVLDNMSEKHIYPIYNMIEDKKIMFCISEYSDYNIKKSFFDFR